MAGVLALVAVALAVIVAILRPKPREVADLPEPSDDVLVLLRLGARVRAIRAYRRQTGATLFEANRVIAHHAA